MTLVVNTCQIGPYTFIEVADHGFEAHAGRNLWKFEIKGQRGFNELYPTLDHALVAAVGERHTGPRGAGGSGVGTAADWFMKMIGVDDLKPAGQDGYAALRAALREDAKVTDPFMGHKVERGLERRGFVIAREAYREGDDR